MDVLKGTAILFTSLQSSAIGWTIPCGPTEIAYVYHVVWALPSCFRLTRLYVIDWTITTWFHSNRALARSMEFESMLLHFFYTIQSPICHVDCLMIANTWIYISLYLRNTAILENKKTVCIFLHQLVNICELHIHGL